ncbi:DTW domain-containing protein 1 [Sipha flava]|uniref:tRNA-uridine aminocarboxypropyltransferase 1 n=1 Tax=Sipha flava TaxID=143950 RepID=A0A8B8G8H3_9HEMI|nr:DTW domain-containing protein 1 [Sipha flava]
MDAFDGMDISDDWQILFTINERQPCRKCSKSRKYFCYTCYTLNADLENKIPRLQLPFKIDIIKHRREIAGKSTAIHAALLAPDDVTIYIYPNLPKYTKDNKVILVYPRKTAVTLKDIYNSNKKSEDNHTKNSNRFITHVLFIDSTWSQSKGILKDPILSGFPCVRLQTRLSQFWRHQKGTPRWYLSTIESIHQILIEYTEAEDQENKSLNNYDNMLFFFRFMYEKIHQLYEHDKLKAYRRPVNI